MTEAIPAVSLEEFLAAEEGSQRRHEFVRGRVYLQAGGTQRHDLLAGLIYEALAPSARARGCLPFIANRMLVTPAGDAYYPDLFIACGGGASRLHETRASLIVEVLSPSTTDIDRREKTAAYAEIPGLKTYLLVHPEFPRIEVALPEQGAVPSWQAYGPGMVVATEFGELDVDELYAMVDRTATAP